MNRKVREESGLAFLIAGAAFVGAYLTLLLVRPAVYGTPLESVTYLVPFAVAVTACLAARRRTSDLERDFWGLLGAGVFVVFVNDLIWAASSSSASEQVPAAAPQWIVLALAACTLFLLLLFRAARAKRAEFPARMRYLTDLLIVVVVCAVLLQVYAIDPILSAHGVVDAPTQFSVTLRISAGLAVLLGLASLVWGLRREAWRQWERAVVAGVAVYALGLLLWPVYFLGDYCGHVEYRPIVVTLWMTGATLVAIGAILRLRSDDPWVALRQLPRFTTTGRWSPLLFHAIGMVAVPVVGFWSLRTGEPANAGFAFVSAIAVGLLMVFRDLWVGLEGGRLFERFSIDPLTRLVSVSYAEEQLAHALGEVARSGEPLSVAILDVDDLGVLNETAGEPVGDRALRFCADVLRKEAGLRDLAARLGDDELMIAMPGATHVEAMMRAEGVRERIARESDATATIGVATFPQDGLCLVDLTANARLAVDWGKRHGKDRVTAHGPDTGSHDIDSVTEAPSVSQHLAAIKVLAMAVDARVAAKRNHSRTVADLAWIVATAAELGQDRADLVRRMALLHDVGKIGIPGSVLLKAGPLTAEERTIVELHAVLGEQIIAAAGLGVGARWVRSHHERWDGGGYPDGLRAVEIPVESRILAVCDAFDAMTSERPQRPAMSISAALQEIDMNMGRQFDPEVADLFIRLAGQRFALNPTGQALF